MRQREAVYFERRSKARTLSEASWLREPRADPLLCCSSLKSWPSTLVRPGLDNTSASSPTELPDRTNHLPPSFLPVFQWYDAQTSAKGFYAMMQIRRVFRWSCFFPPGQRNATDDDLVILSGLRLNF